MMMISNFKSSYFHNKTIPGEFDPGGLMLRLGGWPGWAEGDPLYGRPKAA